MRKIREKPKAPRKAREVAMELEKTIYRQRKIPGKAKVDARELDELADWENEGGS
jgi:hypothetical protein